MTTATLLAALAMLAGAAIQSGIGFGFAIVAAPAVALTDGPATAAPTLALASLVTSSLVVVADRERREVLRPVAVRLVAWSIPGMLAGTVILARVPARPLSLLVAAGVLGAVVVQAAGMRRAAGGADAPDRPGRGALAGGISGLLQTSVGLNGPPLVLHLLRRRATPEQVRGTLAAVFLTLSVISLAVFAVAGTLDTAARPGLLVAAAVAGWAAGRLAFDRLQPVHEPLALTVLATGAVLAVVQAVI